MASQPNESKDSCLKGDCCLSFSKLKQIKASSQAHEAVKIAWKVVRDVIALRLMGERGCAVPYLHESAKYGLLNVLVKEHKSLTDKVTRKPALMIWSAPLENLLPANANLEEFRAVHQVELDEKDSKDTVTYHFHNKDKQPKGSVESVEIMMVLQHVQHYRAHSNQAETAVDVKVHFPGTAQIDKCYLITEVYIAQSVNFTVSVSEHKFHWSSTGLTPIGIIFRKCQLSPTGMLTIGEEVERKKAIDYNWAVAEKNVEAHEVRETLVKKQ